jgi:ketosteroid isomerase-like protein
MDQQTKDEVLAVYAAYAAAFRANDVQAIDKLIQYPLAYIGNGQTKLVDTYPIQPAELIAAKQWHDTKDIAYEVVSASPDKAHLVLRHGKRVPPDGSPIETVSAFYALTRTPSGWKFFALSDITIPAE